MKKVKFNLDATQIFMIEAPRYKRLELNNITEENEHLEEHEEVRIRAKSFSLVDSSILTAKAPNNQLKKTFSETHG